MVLAVGCEGFKSSACLASVSASPPIGFYQGMRMLDQGIGQNGAGKSIVFVERMGLAQQLNRFGGPPLRKQFLAFGDKAAGFGTALDAILSQLFQLGQLRIGGEIGGRASQQLHGVSVVARMQTDVDLLY